MHGLGVDLIIGVVDRAFVARSCVDCHGAIDCEGKCSSSDRPGSAWLLLCRIAATHEPSEWDEYVCFISGDPA